MIYYLTSGVFCYAKRSAKQTIYAGVQENGCRNHEKEHLSIYAAMQEFGINDHKIIERWERIYLEEGPEGLSVERRGRSSTGRSKKLPKEVEEDLLAEVQRLRAENDYLKICKPWFWKTSDASTKSAGSSEAKAKTRTQYSALNRSTTPCYFLLSFEADAERRQICIC